MGTPSAEQLVDYSPPAFQDLQIPPLCSRCLERQADDMTLDGLSCAVACCLVAAVVLVLAAVYRPGVLSRVQQGCGRALAGAAAGVRYAQIGLSYSMRP